MVEFSSQSESSSWLIWLSSIILSLAFSIGLPLNGATILIFNRRKKLRHLVNFLLLLDCVSHLVFCLICIPIQIFLVWSFEFGGSLASLSAMQQVVGDFANLFGIFLSVSIAILRYRRLCWKKKDKFTTGNALKWSLLSGLLALAITMTDCETWFTQLLSGDAQLRVYGWVVFLFKALFLIISALTICFCYAKVSQKVWSNLHEKVLDEKVLKKSSLHILATLHSSLQVILCVAIIIPYLYEEGMEREERFQTTVSVAKNENNNSNNDILKNNPYFASRIICISINYTLLALGTPAFYIASCQRYREQFKKLFFGEKEIYSSNRRGSSGGVGIGRNHHHHKHNDNQKLSRQISAANNKNNLNISHSSNTNSNSNTNTNTGRDNGIGGLNINMGLVAGESSNSNGVTSTTTTATSCGTKNKARNLLIRLKSVGSGSENKMDHLESPQRKSSRSSSNFGGFNWTGNVCYSNYFHSNISPSSYKSNSTLGQVV